VLYISYLVIYLFKIDNLPALRGVLERELPRVVILSVILVRLPITVRFNVHNVTPLPVRLPEVSLPLDPGVPVSNVVIKSRDNPAASLVEGFKTFVGV
jgi:hypothetical protein